jgi:hypothetical protein
MASDEIEYVCALSGKVASESALVDDGGDDNLGALPVGWLEITIRRREPNPAWDDLQRRKARLVESTWMGIAAQLPEEISDADRADVRGDVQASFDAQFAYAFSQMERYNVEEVTVYVAANDAQVKGEWDKVAESLGLSDE